MEFLLIGANFGHFMVGCKYGNPDKFADYLTGICRQRNIKLIAEGLNAATLGVWSVTESVGQVVARNLDLVHLFCDPDFREREQLGIPSLKQLLEDRGLEKDEQGEYAMWSLEVNEAIKQDERSFRPIREKAWLGKVERAPLPDGSLCVFLMGTDHVDSFSQLLSAHGLSNTVLNKRWEA